jgi:membrane-anchored protein YejM (alkaline phosphatase superfamily)
MSGDHTNFYGLREMYGHVDSYFDGATARHYMNDDQLIVDHLGGFPSADGTPVMMQFHLMSAHMLSRRHSDAMRYRPATNYFATNRVESVDTLGAINFYDNGVVQADTVIARLLEILEYKGYLKDALVVVTADHGEQLGEHGIYKHAYTVHEPVLRVPLMFLAYGYKPAQAFAPDRVPTQVDIAPTILTELGMPLPATWSGKPLQQADNPPFSYFQQVAEVGLIDHRHPGHTWKYWVNVRSGEEHAYELNNDPAENNNAIAGVAAALKQEWRLGVLPGTMLSFNRL